MTKLHAVVVDRKHVALALLAAAVLRRRAAEMGIAVEVAVHAAEGASAHGSVSRHADAEAVLLVGEGGFPIHGSSGLRRIEASIDDVLADAEAVLRRTLSLGPAALIVGVTACTTGVAHTFLAAEAIDRAAADLGYRARIERRGSVGPINLLTPEEIATAEIVLIAADTQVDLDRFSGKRIHRVGTKAAIRDPQAVIREAMLHAAVRGATNTEPVSNHRMRLFESVYRHLMTGVSHMLPFVIAGGLLIALSFAVAGIDPAAQGQSGSLGRALSQIGGAAAFTLIVPVLAGYIAYSIADRPGLAPGMIGGFVAASLGAGFIGGILAGFLAGYSVSALNKFVRLPTTLATLKPMLLLPLLGTLVTGLALIYVLGPPTAAALGLLTAKLVSLQGASALLLGALIGAMMAFDMGGPVNKAAYTFATGLIVSGIAGPMAAVMAAGMTPPLGLALASKLFKNLFTADERAAASSTAVLGLSFITEGAIPFAARDPFRVIPALVAGSAVAGSMAMALGAEVHVPHGGAFVWPIPNTVTHLGSFILALAAGTCITAVALRVLKAPQVRAVQ